MGRRLWGGCGCFSWGGGGGDSSGEEETPGQRQLSRFRRTTQVSEDPFLCYILYIEQRRFCYHHEEAPGPRRPGKCTYDVQVSTTRRPVPHIEDSSRTATPRSATDSTEKWVWCFMHMWFMLHVISVICLV